MSNAGEELAEAMRLAAAGRLPAARARLERLVAQGAGGSAARYNLALVMLNMGALEPALRHLNAILSAEPHHAPALFSKGQALVALGRVGEALAPLKAATAGGAVAEQARLAYANALRASGRSREAIGAYRAAIRAAPRAPGPAVNLAQMLLATAPGEARKLLESAVARMPHIAILHSLLGQALGRQDQPDAAIDAFRRALTLDPGLHAARGHLLRALREAARWDEEDEVFGTLRATLAAMGAEAVGTASSLPIPSQHALFHSFGGAELLSITAAEARWRTARQPTPPPRTAPVAAPPLTIGYLSPDFRNHATMHLALEVLERHDRNTVKVIAFSEGPADGSDWEARARAAVDEFIDLQGVNDDAAADIIAQRGVHVLVDMSLYTRHHRPGIPFRRPAPVQVSWLGLPASAGAPWFDYAVVDDVVAPPSHAAWFSEKLVWMPGTYQPNLSWQAPPPPPERAGTGLPEDAVVFASFNGHRKIDRATFRLWMEVLTAVPDSVLWLLEPPAAAWQRLRAAAADHGVAPARLIAAPRLPREQHLHRVAQADLFLDSLIYGAHTTAADALRQGVPVLTILGPTFASRVAASLLTALGLTEMIAADQAGYVRMAARLGHDREALAALRQRVLDAAPASPLFDPERFARALESAYGEMWRRHAAGEPPTPLRVADLPTPPRPAASP